MKKKKKKKKKKKIPPQGATTMTKPKKTTDQRRVSREEFMSDPLTVVRAAVSGTIAVHDDNDGSVRFTISRPVITDEEVLGVKR